MTDIQQAQAEANVENLHAMVVAEYARMAHVSTQEEVAHIVLGIAVKAYRMGSQDMRDCYEDMRRNTEREIKRIVDEACGRADAD